MKLNNILRQPYLNAETDLGGGDDFGDVIIEDVIEQPEVKETVKTEETLPKVDEVKAEPKFKIKYNHNEEEVDLPTMTELAQKGKNYEKAVEKAKQEARDSYILEQGYEWNGKPISTEAEYKQALYEKELSDKGHSPEEIKKLVDENPEVKKAKEIVARDAEAEKDRAKQKDQMDFLSWFKTENGRDFDTNKDTIPKDVWEENAKGVSLLSAYAKYENQSLREKIRKLEQNDKNDKKAPVGGVSKHGSINNVADPIFDGFDD